MKHTEHFYFNPTHFGTHTFEEEIVSYTKTFVLQMILSGKQKKEKKPIEL